MAEELLPKPQVDLPLPEKEIPAHATPQGQALQNQKPNIFKSKLFLGFVAFSILIAFLIGGFMLGRNSVFKELNPSNPVPPPADPVVYASPTPDPTTDWQTYENKKFGFSMKLPDDFKLRQELNETRNIEATQETALYQVVIFDSAKKNISLIINLGENSNFPTNEGYRTFIRSNYGDQEFRDLLVDGINAVYYTTLAGGPGQAEPDYHVNVQLASNSKTYDFSLDSRKDDGPQEELLKKILSTFKFTN